VKHSLILNSGWLAIPAGTLPENSGKRIQFTGMSIFKLDNGQIVSEIGEEDALKAALQLGVIEPKV